MSGKNNGGPAFPDKIYTGQVEYVEGIGNRHVMEDAPGMTLRDYFAAKAMQSILGHLAHGIRPQDCIVMAEDAYTVADAMLKAREAK